MFSKVAIVAILGRAATAQPIASTDPASREPVAAAPQVAPTPARESTAADVAAAPLPGDESGRTDDPETDSVSRRVARAALVPPRLLLEAAMLPVRGAVWAQARYHLDDLYYRTFFNADRTIGLYPTAEYATGFGFKIGARFVDTDLLGASESLALQATTGEVTGDSYHEGLLASLNSGTRLGRLQLGVEGTFDRRPTDPFFGIGNADLDTMPATPVDPRSSATAVSTRYRYQEERASAYADARIVDALHVRVTGAVADHAYGRAATGDAIDAAYDTAGLVGWPGFSTAYGELELRMDERRRATQFEPHDLHSKGWLAAAALGRVHRLDGGPDFWRGTVELQEFLRFASGPRMLALRFRGEAVSGTTAEVPFSELPTLGGGDFLRGYDFGRFRDRVSALGTAEYVWDLAHWFDAAVFVDTGRVFSSLSNVGADHLRVGFGTALQIYGASSFLFELGVASSIDGGLFINLSFNPVFDARPRWR